MSMFKFLFIFVLSIHQLVLASETISFCTPIVDSKKYITNEFSHPYPREVIFSCLYECKADEHTDLILGTSSVIVRNILDDAKKVVCEGIKVKKVSWGWDFDRVEPFYAYSSHVSEIKKWASLNISRDNSHEKKLLRSLKFTLLAVASGYEKVATTEFKYFGEAAKTLNEIAKGLPQNPSILDFYISKIPQHISMDTSDGLVYGILMNSARFRLK